MSGLTKEQMRRAHRGADLKEKIRLRKSFKRKFGKSMFDYGKKKKSR